nr:hypothetical protein [uncultured Lachnoclostridium sp.]
MDDMVTKKTWQEFRDSGLLWWINMILHTFLNVGKLLTYILQE